MEIRTQRAALERSRKTTAEKHFGDDDKASDRENMPCPWSMVHPSFFPYPRANTTCCCVGGGRGAKTERDVKKLLSSELWQNTFMNIKFKLKCEIRWNVKSGEM